MNITNVMALREIDSINHAAQDCPEDFMEQTDRAFQAKVEGVAKALQGKARIVMIAGPSGSGKTTTAHMLTDCLQKDGVGSLVVSLDDFYLGRERAPKLPDGSSDFETVHALNLPLLQQCMKDILEKGACDMPRFDFQAGLPSPERVPVHLGQKDIVIFEGIHALDPLVAGTVQGEVCKVFISVATGIEDDGTEVLSPRSLRLVRRMTRDFIFRNSSPQHTLKLWSGVIRGEEKYLMPHRHTADLQINSFHPYEPCVFRDNILALLAEVREEDENVHFASEILRYMSRFTPICPDWVPKNSLLREFIGPKGE